MLEGAPRILSPADRPAWVFLPGLYLLCDLLLIKRNFILQKYNFLSEISQLPYTRFSVLGAQLLGLVCLMYVDGLYEAFLGPSAPRSSQTVRPSTRLGEHTGYCGQEKSVLDGYGIVNHCRRLDEYPVSQTDPVDRSDLDRAAAVDCCLATRVLATAVGCCLAARVLAAAVYYCPAADPVCPADLDR
jgi:hypothetical protein